MGEMNYIDRPHIVVKGTTGLALDHPHEYEAVVYDTGEVQGRTFSAYGHTHLISTTIDMRYGGFYTDENPRLGGPMHGHWVPVDRSVLDFVRAGAANRPI